MGTTVSPIEPSETMFTLQNGAVNAGFIFFTLAILATLIFGRFVCGWGCHIVALQDFCAWLLKKMGLKPKPFRSRLLVYVPLLAAVYMFVWPTIYRYIVKTANEPLVPQFTNHIITTEFWATFPTIAVAIPFLFVCGFCFFFFSTSFPAVRDYGATFLPREGAARWRELIAQMDRAISGFVYAITLPFASVAGSRSMVTSSKGRGLVRPRMALLAATISSLMA